MYNFHLPITSFCEATCLLMPSYEHLRIFTLHYFPELVLVALPLWLGIVKKRSITQVMAGTMAFFHTTPIGRIVNRFSKVPFWDLSYYVLQSRWSIYTWIGHGWNWCPVTLVSGTIPSKRHFNLDHNFVYHCLAALVHCCKLLIVVLLLVCLLLLTLLIRRPWFPLVLLLS